MIDLMEIGITIGVAAIGVVVTLVATRLTINRVLGWYSLPPVLVAKLDGAGVERLELRYDGADVQVARIYTLSIKNRGLRAIRPGDFDGPIRIHCQAVGDEGGDLEVLNVEPVESSKALEEVEPTLVDGEIFLNPVLWNPRNWVSMDILVSGKPEAKWNVEGLLAETRIVRSSPSERKWAWVAIGLGTYMVVVTLAALVLVPDDPFVFLIGISPILVLVIGLAIWQSEPVRILRGLKPLPRPKNRW